MPSLFHKFSKLLQPLHQYLLLVFFNYFLIFQSSFAASAPLEKIGAKHYVSQRRTGGPTDNIGNSSAVFKILPLNIDILQLIQSFDFSLCSIVFERYFRFFYRFPMMKKSSNGSFRIFNGKFIAKRRHYAAFPFLNNNPIFRRPVNFFAPFQVFLISSLISSVSVNFLSTALLFLDKFANYFASESIFSITTGAVCPSVFFFPLIRLFVVLIHFVFLLLNRFYFEDYFFL